MERQTTLRWISAQQQPSMPAEAAARDALCHAVWGGSLSPAQFIERESRLWQQPFSQRGLRLWLLSQGDAVLASCETYAVTCRTDGKSGLAHGVASVFVEERLRGQGHASALLRGVHAQLQREGSLCTYLMSEVDPGIYARLGYVERRVRARRYAAQLSAPCPNVDWLRLDQLDDSLSTDAGDGLSLSIDADFVRWHIARGAYHAQVQCLPRQIFVGPRVGKTWALCADDPEEGLLRVLVLRSDGDPQALRDVLLAVRHMAAQQGLPTVELWENEGMRHLPFAAADIAQDLDVVPMLRPLSSGIDAHAWQSCERGHWI